MSREQWRATWRWMRLEKQRLAWEHGPTYPETPMVIDYREWCLAYLSASSLVPVRRLGTFDTRE